MQAGCAVPEDPSAWSLIGCASWWTAVPGNAQLSAPNNSFNGSSDYSWVKEKSETPGLELSSFCGSLVQLCPGRSWPLNVFKACGHGIEQRTEACGYLTLASWASFCEAVHICLGGRASFLCAIFVSITAKHICYFFSDAVILKEPAEGHCGYSFPEVSPSLSSLWANGI